MATSPKDGPEVPFDKGVIETLRKQADEHLDTPYERLPFTMNWLWFQRMVTTMERSLS